MSNSQLFERISDGKHFKIVKYDAIKEVYLLAPVDMHRATEKVKVNKADFQQVFKFIGFLD